MVLMAPALDVRAVACDLYDIHCIIDISRKLCVLLLFEPFWYFYLMGNYTWMLEDMNIYKRILWHY